MTKTSDQKAAALRFANANGYYSHTDRKYSLAEKANADVQKLRADEYAALAKRRLIEHQADLRIVMSLLGVEDQYEDTVATQTVFTGSYTLGYGTQEVVTETAVQKFAKDLRAAQSAVEGEAALKRLRKAIKTVQKEQSK